MKRVVTALLLIPFFCYIVLWAPQWAFLVTVAVVAVLCFREYSELAALHGIGKPGLFGYAAGLLVLLLPGKDGAFFVLMAILAMSLALRSREMAQALPDAAALLLGVAYVFGSLRCGCRVARDQSILAVLCVVAQLGGRHRGSVCRTDDRAGTSWRRT